MADGMNSAKTGKRLEPSARYLLHLIACGLHGKTPAAPPAGASWERVHAFAAQNSVEGAAWAGARHLAADMPAELARAWEGEADATLWRRLQFDAERERVIAALEQAGFSYLPLKGVLVAPMYPDPSMRSMADNDILYGRVEPDPAGGWRVAGATEKERAETVKRSTAELVPIMEGLGFETDHVGAGNADCFIKRPIFNFEMHRVLFEGRYEHIAGPFKNPWARAVPDAPGSRSFHLEPTDLYLYLLDHSYKHYTGGGTGVRSAVDEYVELEALEPLIDRARLERDLAAMGMTGFESGLRAAAREAFGPRSADDAGLALSPASEEMLCYMMGAGTYGYRALRVRNRVARDVADGASPVAAKLRYLGERFMMRPEDRAAYYPRVGSSPLLLPLFVVARAGKLIARAPKVASEVVTLKRTHPDRPGR